MIICRTPFRISFFGGGTDYPAWYEENGGGVLSTTINKYTYISCRHLPPFFEHKSRVVWSKIEQVTDNGEIDHPAVKAALSYMGVKEGVEIHHDGDLPARAGLGSSSAFAVGIIHALHALQGRMIGKSDLAKLAIHVEQDLLKENVGVQDQIATAFGGLNRIRISRDHSFSVEPVMLPHDRLKALEHNLLLFYTGLSRHASEMAKDTIQAIPNKKNELRRMQAMVDIAVDALAGESSLDDFGRLLDEAWQLKRSLSANIAPAFVDGIYAKARAAGALGGKLLGAGGGGFILFYVPAERRQDVLNALSDLLVVPFESERDGSKIIFYDRDQYSRTALSERRFVRYS